jgi:hypothetical protein
MEQSSRRNAVGRILGLCIVASVVLVATTSGRAKGPSVKQTMKFAAEMASRGNWREASFRWEKLLANDTTNAKIYNNLAVAAEATGRIGRAAELYAQALEQAGGDPLIAENFQRYGRLVEILLERDHEEADRIAVPEIDLDRTGDKAKGKSARVAVMIPIPPRIDLDGIESVLVTSFRSNESALVDVNRELTRFLRGELRQRTALEVRDVVPPPAIPEQRIEDLAKNEEFWKHLGREYDADLIVSGVVTFDRVEVSGFEDVDIVDPRTGQKVRQSQFVEKEEFSYLIDLLFVDGSTGKPLHRDRLRRQVRFRGLHNDPLHAFYELSESLGDDIISVVSTRMRAESRVIFKR